jgi:hypothetical protein
MLMTTIVAHLSAHVHFGERSLIGRIGYSDACAAGRYRWLLKITVGGRLAGFADGPGQGAADPVGAGFPGLFGGAGDGLVEVAGQADPQQG